MQNYLVIYEIDISAESAEAAALIVERIIKDPESARPVFDVVAEDGEKTRIDLEELNTETDEEPLYYPCIADPKTGHISRKLIPEPMPREVAENYLRRNYPRQWVRGEAIPQPVDHRYFR